MSLRRTVGMLALCALLVVPVIDAEEGRLLRFPDVHGDTVVFSYAGDLYTVPAAGGTAVRLTSHQGIERFPKFSPDGRWIAFTGQYDGSNQVFVIPATGGMPKQLTWYPNMQMSDRNGVDGMVYDWTPDGKKVFFYTMRDALGIAVGQGRIYTVDVNGGLPTPLPMPESGAASFSPDGTKVAYNPIMRDFRTWKRYKGGRAQDIYLFDLKSYAWEKITDWVGTDNFPMWRGNNIWFTSDREPSGRLNLWKYDLTTKQFSQITRFSEFDVKTPSIGGDTIVFECGGYLYLQPLAGGEARKITVHLPGDTPLAMKSLASFAPNVDYLGLSPGGSRAVFTARGEVFTLPAKDGNTRNLTNTPGIREKFATWSPDGKWIAYLSDRSGEDEIYLRAQDGSGEETRLTTDGDRIRFAPVWSPDSKKIAWSDKSLRLYWLDIEAKKPVLVDTAEAGDITDYAWSPDSRWIAYSKPKLYTNFRAIHLYSLENAKSTKVSGDMNIDVAPEFDPEGKYLYFLSFRDYNTTFDFAETNAVLNPGIRPYLVTLATATPHPFAPKSDEVKIAEEKKEGKPAEEPKKDGKTEDKKDAGPAPITVDLAGIGERVVGFPLPPGGYGGIAAAKGMILYTRGGDLYVYDMKERKETQKLAGILGFGMSPDHGHLIYSAPGSRFGIVAATPAPAKVGDGALDLSQLEGWKDPRAEWVNGYKEAWRRYRDFFYDPDMHGVDWKKLGDRYAALLPHVAHGADFAYLLGELVGELNIGHSYITGGDQPVLPYPGAGLLGAQFAADSSGYYRITRIYRGENWHEGIRSPLTEVGTDVKEGDLLIAIDGVEVKTTENPYRHLFNKADRAVTLMVNDKPTREGARAVTVRPVANEAPLRYWDWVRSRREYVEKASGGRLAYVHIPNMFPDGLSAFFKYYFAQIDKEGLVVDIRYNAGGFISQIVLERLRRVMIGMGYARNYGISTYPDTVFVGPMVAITNAHAASDGDIFGYFFKEYKLGKLIGTRSWGGVVGIRGFPPLINGTDVSVPEFSTYSRDSQWIIEGHGVDPDIVVENPPADVIAGRDPQLDKAVQVLLEEIKANPKKRAPVPQKFPVR